MRWLIDYLRTLACDHNWFPLKQRDILSGDSGDVIGTLYYTHCQKCMRPKKWKITG